MARLLSAPDLQFGPATLVLSNGRIVSNPLATTVRFAHANRGEGQLQAPALAQWNARIARRFGLGTRHLEIALSVLNITNRDALQEYLSGHNQIGSANFAYAPDGTFRGQNRQAARTAQLSLRFDF